MKLTESADKTISSIKTKKVLAITCSAILILVISLILFYFSPIYLKFQVPTSQPHDFSAYISESDPSGGITMTKNQLTLEDYSKITAVLDSTALKRTFAWDESSRNTYAPWDLRATYTNSEPHNNYLSELRLYSKDADNYVIVFLDGKEQVYQIADEQAVQELIILLESFSKS